MQNRAPGCEFFLAEHSGYSQREPCLSREAYMLVWKKVQGGVQQGAEEGSIRSV